MNIEQATPIPCPSSRFYPLGKPGTMADRAKDGENAELRKATQDFEAIFVAYLMKVMQDTVPKSGLLGSGLGEDYFRSLFHQEIASQMSRTQGLGIGDALYRDLTAKTSREPQEPVQMKGNIEGDR